MAKSSKIELSVVTPEREVLTQMVDSVVVPAHDGELGVLPGRSSLMCELGVGQMRYYQNGQVNRYFIDGGFAQVHQDKVAVLTPRAAAANEITEQMAAAEEQLAEKIVAPDARATAYRRVSTMRNLMARR